MSGYTNGQLRDLVAALRASNPDLMGNVERAFANCTFIYGTQGKKGGGLKLGGIMVSAINKLEHTLKKPDGTRRPAFEPHSRAYAFQTGVRQTVQRAHNYQMMDMLYGDGGNVGRRANPHILEFVMYAAKLRPWPGANPPASPQFDEVSRGEVTANHPFFAYQQILGTAEEEQAFYKHPKTTNVYGRDPWCQVEMPGTKELSRIIRWCIGEFGGTIIFEGADVYYDQVFNNTGRFGDTELEACSFFAHFNAGNSFAHYGKAGGKVIFHWHGQETVPSKLLFLTSWRWDPFSAEQWYQKIHARNMQQEIRDQFADPSFVVAHQDVQHGNQTYQRQGGAGNYEFRRGRLEPRDIDDLARRLGLTHQTLWNNFNTLPPGVSSRGVGQWLNSQM